MVNYLMIAAALLSVSLIAIDGLIVCNSTSPDAGTVGDDFKYCLLLGGSVSEEGGGISYDGSGNIIVTGSTGSEDFPTHNAYDSTHNSRRYADFFIIKFSSTKQLSWSTFLGGNASDYCEGVTVDSLGDVVVVGSTESADFPALHSYATVHHGMEDGVVAKFSAEGSLLWSTFLGGNSIDRVYAAAVDSQDNILVTGSTDSEDFPLSNVSSAGYSGKARAFVAKFSAEGSLIWSRSIDGNVSSRGLAAVAIDGEDNILVTGSYSRDALVVKLSSEGLLLWKVLLGGKEDDSGRSIGITSQNDVLVTGSTESVDFPTVSGFDISYNGGDDSFAAKLSPSGELVWSTYLGGSEDDTIRAVVVDGDDNVLIAGDTFSTDFPVLNATDSTHNGQIDAFVAKLSVNGSLLWSTFLGGSSSDWCSGVAVDNWSNVLVAGTSMSSDLPGTITRLGPNQFIVCEMFLYSSEPIYSPPETTNGAPAMLFFVGIPAVATVAVVKKQKKRSSALSGSCRN